ncbi:hypothetical protein ABK040_014993 [Willaertia magna]
MSIVEQYPLTSTASLVALSYYVQTILNVGRMRGVTGVKAPATTGDIRFENAFRVQMNTLEQLPVALSAFWLAALSSGNDKLVGSVGLVYTLGRVLFQLGYPDKRSAGFGISFFSLIGLLGLSAYKIVPLLRK